MNKTDKNKKNKKPALGQYNGDTAVLLETLKPSLDSATLFRIILK